jgi:MFS family permease
VLGGVPTAIRPLRHRDFRLLWTGLAISLVGSGLWSSLLFALVLVLFIIGPLEVLLPFAIRDNLAGGAEDYGLALASFGVGGAAGALAISSGRLPRRYLTVMILMWGFGSLPFAVIGVAGALWVMCAALFAVGATYSAAMVIWGSLLQRRVPEGLRGRGLVRAHAERTERR